MFEPSIQRTPATSWIAMYQPRVDARLRLFCLPFAGGGASSYRTWQEGLPRHIEVVPVQLPGREDRFREEPLRRMEDLVEGMIDGLLPLMTALPFAFFGHSLGSIVALEATRSLARRRAPLPRHLIISARPAPQLPLRRTPVHDLSQAEVEQWMRQVGGTPTLVLENRELMDLIVPALRADLEINDMYRSSADPVLTCPLTAVGGNEDDEALPHELEAWSPYTSNSFELHTFKGNHFFPFNESRPAVLALIAETLAKGRLNDIMTPS